MPRPPTHQNPRVLRPLHDCDWLDLSHRRKAQCNCTGRTLWDIRCNWITRRFHTSLSINSSFHRSHRNNLHHRKQITWEHSNHYHILKKCSPPTRSQSVLSLQSPRSQSKSHLISIVIQIHVFFAKKATKLIANFKWSFSIFIQNVAFIYNRVICSVIFCWVTIRVVSLIDEPHRAGPKLTQSHLTGDKFWLVYFYRKFSIVLEKIR